ncbi:DUF6624 domain-containing protein [Streptomyces sp. NPDC058045]|uniref:DUF6624 domain-containing protein n=1 Tax=Streptomyces sp. NPDC058045 TaxID=3346311 RepID=UPI0036EBAA63
MNRVDGAAQQGSSVDGRQPSEAPGLACELLARAEEDRRLTRRAHPAATDLERRRIAQCRRDNTRALRKAVAQHGWPTTGLVGEQASTAALMILLHAEDVGFQLTCRDLIARAAADGDCPVVHHAFIADHCAVELGQPQFYGTRVDPKTLAPYDTRQLPTLDERRRDVGLGPLADQMRTLRLPR